MSYQHGWTMSDEAAESFWESEHPVCEHCKERCCIRPEGCCSCPDEDIGMATGPDKLHVHVGCRSAYENELAVMDVADAVKVLRTRDGVALTDEQATERGRNIVSRLIAMGWGPL